MTSKISTHAPHTRRDLLQEKYLEQADDFYSRASHEARLQFLPFAYTSFPISTHAPHTRRDGDKEMTKDYAVEFLLTRLTRGATSAPIAPAMKWEFLLTRLTRGATQTNHTSQCTAQFLLTRLTRGATVETSKILAMRTNFYSRASHEARPGGQCVNLHILDISTHAPHTRRDPIAMNVVTTTNISTHAPHTRRDEERQKKTNEWRISTHAPHTRRDHLKRYKKSLTKKFLLTRLTRGATIREEA